MTQDEKMLAADVLDRLSEMMCDCKADGQMLLSESVANEHGEDLQALLNAYRALSAAPAQPDAVEGAGEPVARIRGFDNVLVVDWTNDAMPPAGTALYAHPSPPADADDIRNIVQQLIIDVLSDGQRGDAPAGLARRDPAVDQILSRVTPAADDALRVAVEALEKIGNLRFQPDASCGKNSAVRIADEALAALKSTAALKAGGVK
jgi:hypothetical protein